MGMLGQLFGMGAQMAGTAIGGPVGGALGGAAAGAVPGAVDGGGKALKPEDQPPAAGFHASGNAAGDKAPVSPIVPSKPNEPATDPEGPRTKFEKVDQFLGSNIGKIGTGIAGGFIDDFRANRKSEKNFRRLKGEGLTAVEIAGGGGAGHVASTGNTLGSGPAQQVKSQQEFTRDENEKNRQLQRDLTATRIGPPRRQAAVSEAGSRRAQDLHPDKQRQLKLELRKMKVDIETKKFDLKNKWPMKFASMGAENGVLALAAYNANLDYEAILTMMPGQNKQDVRDLIDWYQKFKSITGRETHGVTQFIDWLGAESRPKDSFPSLGGAIKREDALIKSKIRGWVDRRRNKTKFGKGTSPRTTGMSER